MSTADSDTKRDDVLLAFSVEPLHDKATLERYLALYPQYAEDFIDLLSELRSSLKRRSSVVEGEEVVQRAWSAFTATPARNGDAAFVVSPFASFAGPTFVALSEGLRIQRSILIALRDRLVLATSIPAPFLDRLARATQCSKERLQAYLNLPAVVATGASYKSDKKPEARAKVSFEQLLDNSGVSAEEKRDICTSLD